MRHLRFTHTAHPLNTEELNLLVSTGGDTSDIHYSPKAVVRAHSLVHTMPKNKRLVRTRYGDVAFLAGTHESPQMDLNGSYAWVSLLKCASDFFIGENWADAKSRSSTYFELPMYTFLHLPAQKGIATPHAVRRIHRDFCNIATDGVDQEFLNYLRTAPPGTFPAGASQLDNIREEMVSIFETVRDGVAFSSPKYGLLSIDS